MSIKKLLISHGLCDGRWVVLLQGLYISRIQMPATYISMNRFCTYNEVMLSSVSSAGVKVILWVLFYLFFTDSCIPEADKDIFYIYSLNYFIFVNTYRQYRLLFWKKKLLLITIKLVILIILDITVNVTFTLYFFMY